MTYTLFAQTTDSNGEAWDTPMGEHYESVEAAKSAIPAMMAEWDAQLTGDPDAGEVKAAQCAWCVWDNETRQEVA